MFRLNRKQNIFSLGKTKVTAKPPEAILSQHEAFCFGQMKCILPLEITVRNTGIFVEKKNITLKSVNFKNCSSKMLLAAKQMKANEKIYFFKIPTKYHRKRSLRAFSLELCCKQQK